jgi:hypothetical protein
MIDMNGDLGTGGQSAGRQTSTIHCNIEIEFNVKLKKKKKKIKKSRLPNMF